MKKTNLEDIVVRFPSNKGVVLNIYGDTLTKEQAQDLILRTDRFFNGSGMFSNKYNDMILERCGFYPQSKYRKEAGMNDIALEIADRKRFYNEFGYVSGLNYLANNWIDTSVSHYGFCHTNGKIEYRMILEKVYLEEVYEDMEKLNNAFPYLEMTIDVEYEEKQLPCVARFQIFKNKKGVSVTFLKHENVSYRKDNETLSLEKIFAYGEEKIRTDYAKCISAVVDEDGNELWTEGNKYRIYRNEENHDIILFNNKKNPILVDENVRSHFESFE